MPRGTLEVLLVNSRGLHNTDFLRKMDPYCILTTRSQQQKSSVASRQGRNPEWNEKFVFNISEADSDLTVRVMDKDTFTSDDFVGEASIPLDRVFEGGSLLSTAYNLVLADSTYCGQIKLSLTFISKTKEEHNPSSEEEDVCGWRKGWF